MISVRYGHATDKGCKRGHNEDALSVHPELGLWLVADGMGGHQKGEVASAIVGQTVFACVQEGSSLSQAVKQAHVSVLNAIHTGQGAPGMGSTVVALRIQDSQRYEVVWVGDSRAYLWNGQELRQLTRDHSFVQQLVDYGAITEAEARNHPHKNIITRAIGFANAPQQQGGEIAVDSISGTLKPGDRLLLCSDGLTGEIGRLEIEEVLSQQHDDQAAVDELIRRALDHGGSDNVTVILISAPEAA